MRCRRGERAEKLQQHALTQSSLTSRMQDSQGRCIEEEEEEEEEGFT